MSLLIITICKSSHSAVLTILQQNGLVVNTMKGKGVWMLTSKGASMDPMVAAKELKSKRSVVNVSV